jgi:hypothetical protein
MHPTASLQRPNLGLIGNLQAMILKCPAAYQLFQSDATDLGVWNESTERQSMQAFDISWHKGHCAFSRCSLEGDVSLRPTIICNIMGWPLFKQFKLFDLNCFSKMTCRWARIDCSLSKIKNAQLPTCATCTLASAKKRLSCSICKFCTTKSESFNNFFLNNGMFKEGENVSWRTS